MSDCDENAHDRVARWRAREAEKKEQEATKNAAADLEVASNHNADKEREKCPRCGQAKRKKGKEEKDSNVAKRKKEVVLEGDANEGDGER